jgi:hypothetical protein
VPVDVHQFEVRAEHAQVMGAAAIVVGTIVGGFSPERLDGVILCSSEDHGSTSTI